jgi:hypothetical protein
MASTRAFTISAAGAARVSCGCRLLVVHVLLSWNLLRLRRSHASSGAMKQGSFWAEPLALGCARPRHKFRSWSSLVLNPLSQRRAPSQVTYLFLGNPFGDTAACYLSRGAPQGAAPSTLVFKQAFNPVHVIARLCGRGGTIYDLTPAGPSGFADDANFHTRMDAVPCM